MTMNSLGALKNLRLITFDVTGTLLKFVKPPVQQYIDMGLKHGVIADEVIMSRVFKEQWVEMNKTMPHYGSCWRAWWTQFVVETFKKSKAQGIVTNERLELIASNLIEHFTTEECWAAKDGARELLLAMKKTIANSTTHNSGLGESGRTPVQIGVLSNFDSRLEKILQVTHLHPHFDFFITSHDCQKSKPDKGIFDVALKTANKNHKTNFIQSHQALHIGDSYSLDYTGALHAGWNSFLVLDSSQHSQLPLELVEQNPPHIFSNLTQLQTFFENLYPQ